MTWAIAVSALLLMVGLGRIATHLRRLAALKADEIASSRMLAETLSEGLRAISQAIDKGRVRRPSVTKPTVEDERKPDWMLDNEERDEIKRVASNLSGSDFARFVAQRYRLSNDDAWVLSVLKTKDSIGFDAAVTMLRQRDRKAQPLAG